MEVTITFDNGYVVLQKFDDNLFVRYIKFNKLNFEAMLTALIAFAKQEGCTKISGVSSRKAGSGGWMKRLRKYGFTQLPDDTIELHIGGSYGVQEQK